MIELKRVPREHIYRLWPLFYGGVRECISSDGTSLRTPMDVLQDWISPTGEHLFVIMQDSKTYLGFATLQLHDFGAEKWGTIGLLYVKHVANIDTTAALAEGLPQLQATAKALGCTHLNYIATRRGFEKLSPKLGFRPRFIEWMKEID